jgi:hypothetical protein
MKNKTYRRLFQETQRQARERHNRPYPAHKPESYTARRNRQADGFEVVNSAGRVVAQAFDDEAEALRWIADNPPSA